MAGNGKSNLINYRKSGNKLVRLIIGKISLNNIVLPSIAYEINITTVSTENIENCKG
jgi:hypothetical protein